MRSLDDPITVKQEESPMKVVIEKSRVIAWLLVRRPGRSLSPADQLWRNEMRYEDERIFLPEQIDTNKILGMVAGSGSVAVRLVPLTENGTFYFARNGEVINKFVGYESEGTESEQPWDSMCAEAQADPEAYFCFPKRTAEKNAKT
jgi:hypothetical protein